MILLSKYWALVFSIYLGKNAKNTIFENLSLIWSDPDMDLKILRTRFQKQINRIGRTA